MGGRDKAPPSAPGVKLPSQRRSLHRESIPWRRAPPRILSPATTRGTWLDVIPAGVAASNRAPRANGSTVVSVGDMGAR